jgi:hypothetical protein
MPTDLPDSPAVQTVSRLRSAAESAQVTMVWNRELPRPLQQILFDTADGVTPSAGTRLRSRSAMTQPWSTSCP